MSLIVEFVKRYETQQQALDALNDILGADIKPHRLYEWCDPDNPRTLPAKIAGPLRGHMMPYLLENEGIYLSKGKLKKLINNLS